MENVRGAPGRRVCPGNHRCGATPPRHARSDPEERHADHVIECLSQPRGVGRFRRGAYPLSGRSWIRFIGTGEDESEETCPEYLDLLSLPGQEEACLEALQALLQEGF